MDAGPLMEYFRPLYTFLQRENAGHKINWSWNDDGKLVLHIWRKSTFMKVSVNFGLDIGVDNGDLEEGSSGCYFLLG
jgi:hypothetical protein